MIIIYYPLCNCNVIPPHICSFQLQRNYHVEFRNKYMYYIYIYIICTFTDKIRKYLTSASSFLLPGKEKKIG